MSSTTIYRVTQQVLCNIYDLSQLYTKKSKMPKVMWFICGPKLVGTPCSNSASSLRSHYLERGTNYFFLFSHPEFANVVGILIFSSQLIFRQDLRSNEYRRPPKISEQDNKSLPRPKMKDL